MTQSTTTSRKVMFRLWSQILVHDTNFPMKLLVHTALILPASVAELSMVSLTILTSKTIEDIDSIANGNSIHREGGAMGLIYAL